MIPPYILGVLAVVPMITGPLPQDEETKQLIAKLCNGGEIVIPLGNDDAPKQERDCEMQGCHAGTCRQKGKRSAQI